MFFDIHSHMYKYPYPTGDGRFLMSTPEQVGKRYAELNITGAAILPILGPELYVPQSVGEVIDMANTSNGKYVAFCNVDPRALTNSSDAPLLTLFEHYKALGCKGIGEVMPQLEWNDPLVQNLLKCAERSGLPLLFDVTACRNSGYGLYDDKGMPQLERALDRYPDLVFIGHGPAFWAEVSELRDENDRFGYPDYPVIKEGRVAALMRRYPNLWVDLSAGSGANAMMRDREHAARFIEEFADRMMYGCDICKEGQTFPFTFDEFLTSMRETGEISEENYRKLVRENAVRLLDIR
jgi:predicted TIM-barrel fold metal-dependent hydrolase